MRQEIKYVGKQVFNSPEELEDGYAKILIEVDEFLDEVDTYVLDKYARYHLDLIHPDDCECESVEDASEDDLVWELKNRNFDFLDEVDQDAMIEYLQSDGYTVDGNDGVIHSDLDYMDAAMLGEIAQKFLESSVFERQDIYDLIKNR